MNTDYDEEAFYFIKRIHHGIGFWVYLKNGVMGMGDTRTAALTLWMAQLDGNHQILF